MSEKRSIFHSSLNILNERWEENQLDATECFIALIICSTCFGHLYAHHQDLETILVLLPHMVCNVLVVGGRLLGAEQHLVGFLLYAYTTMHGQTSNVKWISGDTVRWKIKLTHFILSVRCNSFLVLDKCLFSLSLLFKQAKQVILADRSRSGASPLVVSCLSDEPADRLLAFEPSFLRSKLGVPVWWANRVS